VDEYSKWICAFYYMWSNTNLSYFETLWRCLEFTKTNQLQMHIGNTLSHTTCIHSRDPDQVSLLRSWLSRTQTGMWLHENTLALAALTMTKPAVSQPFTMIWLLCSSTGRWDEDGQSWHKDIVHLLIYFDTIFYIEWLKVKWIGYRMKWKPGFISNQYLSC